MGMKINAYVIGSIGTNCYLVWDEGSKEAMIVDPAVYDQLIERTIIDNELVLKYVFLTHGHFDHIGGVSGFLGVAPGTVFAASIDDKPLLGGLDPDLCLNDGDVLSLGALSFRVIATPGHTEGGLSLYIPETDSELTEQAFSGTVFPGDTLFQMSIGRTDLEGGDFTILKSSIREKLFALPDDTLVLPGHMGATTIGNEKKYNPFVK